MDAPAERTDAERVVRPAPRSPDSLLARVSAPEPLVTVELRPPQAGLSSAESMDAWIDLHHAVRRLSAEERLVFMTDNAVGTEEEENLAHLVANLGDGGHTAGVVPFLTLKHTLEYCMMYAERAAAAGVQALAVLGGDRTVGRPRCLPHAHLLRARIRERVPGLALGGWANPHRHPEEQAGFLAAPDAHVDFFLSQVVSHHSASQVEAFVRALSERGVEAPGVFGVFYYRSANPRTLERLSEFFPVPVRELTREFDAGAGADEICARSIRALRDAGATRVYVSNLGLRKPEARLRRILELL